MARIYRIKRVPTGEVNWENVPSAPMDCMPWRGMEAPSAQGQVAFDGEAFRVRLKAWEKADHIRCYTPNGNVWLDNTCEFFFNPTGRRSGAYLNFEVNGAGVPHIGFGALPKRTVLDPATFDQFHLQLQTTEEYWAVTFDIPVAVLDALYGFPMCYESGSVLNGNFQKCLVYGGGKDHAAVWNPIPEDTFAFHTPQFFGALILD